MAYMADRETCESSCSSALNSRSCTFESLVDIEDMENLRRVVLFQSVFAGYVLLIHAVQTPRCKVNMSIWLFCS